MSGATILAVDDEPINLEILSELLLDAGYSVEVAADGLDAWNRIQASPEKFEAILLDRMMPSMNGMEFLAKIKNDPECATIPVILQTARAAKTDIVEGLQAGAHYYLCKPYDEPTLLAVVATAVGDYRRYRTARADAMAASNTLKLLDHGSFKFQNLTEARELSALLSKMSYSPEVVAMGLAELFVNAIEHGNLGLTYQDKSILKKEGGWDKEVARRLTLPENQTKFVTVKVKRSAEELEFRIIDEGQGFNWEEYLTFSPNRAFDTHGRGIALARQLSFSQLQYLGKGNDVVATINIKDMQL